jgi:polyhydroxyalkanoate synthesis repressor PhaR
MHRRSQFVPIIKRYPNRKLYDMDAKKYITLEGIAKLIRQGENVQVVDHATGEDLTAVTLTQIIFEQQKKRSGFLPQTVLTGLIQAGGDTMASLRHGLASSLDLARHVDEEIERRVQALIKRGELAAEDGRRLRDKLLSQTQRAPDTAWPSEQHLKQVLEEQAVPTRDDLDQILEQLDALARKLDEVATDSKSSLSA